MEPFLHPNNTFSGLYSSLEVSTHAPTFDSHNTVITQPHEAFFGDFYTTSLSLRPQLIFQQPDGSQARA